MDVEWRVENYGVEPDIIVDFEPSAHLRGEDPQLERALREVLSLLEGQKTDLPKFEKRPNLALPV
jgi:tricorn protease